MNKLKTGRLSHDGIKPDLTEHEVSVVVLHLGQPEQDDPGQQQRGLAEILLGEETLSAPPRHSLSTNVLIK